MIDTGSTKRMICRAVDHHPNRGQFVASHPIAGTENSGPDAAFEGLFRGKTNIICEQEKSSKEALMLANRVFTVLGLETIFMEPEEHDKHVAYVSHLSHVSSFLLGQTVLDIERDEKNIFALAGSGFRFYRSVGKKLTGHVGTNLRTKCRVPQSGAAGIHHALAKISVHHLMKTRGKKLHKIMTEANRIREILNGIELETTQTKYCKINK